MAQKQHSIKDKEVGELWRMLCGAIDHECSLARHGRDLIRKLVEERAVCIVQLSRRNHEEAEGLALRDFGIDPETWK